MNVEVEGPPERWVASGGAPSPAMSAEWLRNFAAYESENGAIAVMENMIVFEKQKALVHPEHAPCAVVVDVTYFFPRSWVRRMKRHPTGLMTLHDGEDAVAWRPLMYDLNRTGLQRLGSQHELDWRAAIASSVLAREIDGRDIRAEAVDRARELLVSMLTPFQRLQLVALGKFLVRGAATENTYGVEVGNGFKLLDPWTHEPLVTYCFHPERWMPHPAVALATKLALEDELLEVEFLERANQTWQGTSDPVLRKPELRRAMELERELVA